ncbi:MAG: sigma-70 family RNA polymerase sigma factor [Gemmatimonadetes bacterium]|nr:sigma-70 family RNA polymerase sigma factor [Gemmatimonadota bacterium]
MRRFRKLCERHRDRVYTFAWYFLGNREDAEDVAQEVLIRLWNHWQEVEPARLPAWITRVARNVCLDLLRKRKSYRAVVSGEGDEEALARVASRGPDPEKLAEASEFQRQLERALQALPEIHRTVVVLREIQGLKYEEIAESLGLPLNTVKVYLHRGRRELREQLRKSMDDE